MCKASGGIPDAALDAIGRASSHTYLVTAKDIRRYAQAIGDPNPLYFDEDYARAAGFDGVVAPPLFCHALAFEDVWPDRLRPDGLPTELDIPLPVARAVGGGSEFNCYGWVRPGDVITVNNVVDDVYVRTGRSGILYFIVLVTTFTNQAGLIVARERATFVNR